MEADSVFSELASIPRYQSVAVVDKESHLQLSVTLSVRDRALAAKATLAMQVHCQKSEPVQSTVFMPALTNTAITLVSHSPSGKYQATFTTIDAKVGLEPQYIVSIVSQSSFASYNVTKAHSQFYTDEFFGNVDWTLDESKIVYVAAQKPTLKHEKYVYVADPGEGFTGKGNPSIFILDLASKNPEPYLVNLEGFSGVARPIFLPDGKSICFVGLECHNVPLGIRYCTNRPSFLYKVHIDGSNLKRIDHAGNARSLQKAPDGTIFFLSNTIGGAHAGCSSLVEVDTVSLDSRVVVPIVKVSVEIFPGLYLNNLTNSCFVHIDGSKFLILSSAWRSRIVVLAIDLNFGKVKCLTPLGNDSWTFHCASLDGWIVASKSCLNDPGSLMLAKFRIDGDVAWQKVHSLNNSSITDIVSIDIGTIPNQADTLETIFVRAKSNAKQNLPLIVMPHGGPHGAFSTDFSTTIASLARLGFHCLLVNYTGSTGFGQDAIEALLGRIGTIDVSEVHAAAKCYANHESVDGTVFLYGGSHGGFITAHLLASQSEFYRGGILRNPVTNIAAMYSDTDIPDWCFFESGIQFDHLSPPNLAPKLYEAMFNMSPVSRIKGKCSPALLMLGANDRRVPVSQGKRWAQLLKGKGSDVRTLVFPDTGHALDSFDAEIAGFLAAYTFMMELLNKS